MGIKERTHKASIDFLAFTGERWTERPMFTENGWEKYVAASSRALLRAFQEDEIICSAYLDQRVQDHLDHRKKSYEAESGTTISREEWKNQFLKSRQAAHPNISADEWEHFESEMAIVDGVWLLDIEAVFLRDKSKKGEKLNALENAVSQAGLEVNEYFSEELDKEFPGVFRNGAMAHSPKHPQDFVGVRDYIESTVLKLLKPIAYRVWDLTDPRRTPR